MITVLFRLLNLVGRWHPQSPPSLVRPAEPRSTAANSLGHRPGRRTMARRVHHLRALSSDAGMTTAEYAVGTVAAVAFAVVLFKVVQSAEVQHALAAIVTGALHVHM